MNKRLAALVEAFERDGYRPDRLAVAGQRRGCAQTLGRARRLLQGARAFPGHQRSLPAQALVGRQRHARGVPRSQLSARRRLVRRLCGSAPRLHHQGRARQRARSGCPATSSCVRKYQRSYDIVRQPLQSRRGRRAQARGAGMPLHGAGRRGARGAGGAGGAWRDASFLIDLSGKLAAGQFTLLARDHRERKRHERRDQANPACHFIQSMNKAQRRQTQERKEAAPR